MSVLFLSKTLEKSSCRLIYKQIREMSLELSDYDKQIICGVRRIIPDLNEKHHKGEHGRIGIIGGSEEYTGAPYFAGISALRVGADLVHVFCSKNAGMAIKSYSPDLIVHPILDSPEAVTEIQKWTPRLHAVVIGPGLGQNETVTANVLKLLQGEAFKGLKVIIDADGLRLLDRIGANPHLDGGILTPNDIEFRRMFPEDDSIETVQEYLKNKSQFIIYRKGERDLIYEPKLADQILGCKFLGSGRRCGGQGDILSGALAVFCHWATKNGSAVVDTIFAMRAAGLLVKLCNYEAFLVKGRGALAVDMIDMIPSVFKNYFE